MIEEQTICRLIDNPESLGSFAVLPRIHKGCTQTNHFITNRYCKRHAGGEFFNSVIVWGVSVMLEPDALKWYALHVRSRHEKSVFAQLDAKHQIVFLPLYTCRHRWADRWKALSLPLFPGYIFCRFDIAYRTSVLATSGVIDIVRSGTVPAPIETAELEAIQAVVNSPLPTGPYAGLVEGERVVMTDGPLQGLEGVVIEVRKNPRLVLSVQLLQRSVLVEIKREWATPVVPIRSALSLLEPGHRLAV